MSYDNPIPLPANEIKLSEIVEKFKEHEFDENDCSCEHQEKIGFIVEEHDRYEWHDVYISKEEFKTGYSGANKESADLRFTVNKDGRILSLSFGWNGELENTLFKKQRYGLEKLIMDMYVSGARVIIDEDDCDPSLPTPYLRARQAKRARGIYG